MVGPDEREPLGSDHVLATETLSQAVDEANSTFPIDVDDQIWRALDQSLQHRRFFVPSGREGHYRFDLPAYAVHRLTAAGVTQVERLAICTYPPENGFFSFRRTTHAGEPDYGRQVSAILLTKVP